MIFFTKQRCELMACKIFDVDKLAISKSYVQSAGSNSLFKLIGILEAMTTLCKFFIFVLKKSTARILFASELDDVEIVQFHLCANIVERPETV